MSTVPPRGLIAGAVLSLVSVLGLSACSGGGDTGSDSAIKFVGGSATQAKLRAEADKLDQRPTDLGISEPITKPIPTNKTLYWMQCGAPACVSLGKDLQRAVDAVGWKLKIVDAGVTAQSIKAAWDQAVTDKPDAVLQGGFSRTLFAPQLAKLAAARIPVITMNTGDKPGDGFVTAFNYADDQELAGERLATYVLAHATKAIHAVGIESTAAYPNLTQIADGFNNVLKKDCANCSMARLDVPVTSIGQDLPTRITGYLRSHPDVNWVMDGFSDMVLGLPAAFKSAGLDGKVKVVTTDNSAATQAYMKNGDVLAASDGFPGPEEMWRSVDYLIRYWNGQSTAPDDAHTLPAWILTGKNVPSTTETFPLVVDYEAQYRKLWNLK